MIFNVLSKDFPTKAYPVLVIEDLPGQRPEVFGELGRTWFGGPQGLKLYQKADLESDVQAQVARLQEALRRDALAAFTYRIAVKGSGTSREKFEQASRLERALKRAIASHHDLSQLATDLAERLAPHATETPSHLADAFTPQPVPGGASPSEHVVSAGMSTGPAPAAPAH